MGEQVRYNDKRRLRAYLNIGVLLFFLAAILSASSMAGLRPCEEIVSAGSVFGTDGQQRECPGHQDREPCEPEEPEEESEDDLSGSCAAREVLHASLTAARRQAQRLLESPTLTALYRPPIV